MEMYICFRSKGLNPAPNRTCPRFPVKRFVVKLLNILNNVVTGLGSALVAR